MNWELLTEQEWTTVLQIDGDPSLLADMPDRDRWIDLVGRYRIDVRRADRYGSRTPAVQRSEAIHRAELDRAHSETVAARETGRETVPVPVPVNHHRGWTRDDSGRWIMSTLERGAPLADPVRSTVPDAFTATRSTVKRSRSNSGRTAVTVLRHGRAVVVGSIDRDETGRWARGVNVVDREVHRDRMGRVTALPVHRWADRWAEQYGVDLPRLAGTDCLSWEQVIRAGDGETVRAETWSNPGDPVTAAIRAGVIDLDTVTVPDIIADDYRADTARAALLADLRDPAGMYGTARPVTRWPVRTGLGMGRGVRAGDPVTVIDTAGTVHLVAPGPDRETRFVGFTKVARPGTVRRSRVTGRRPGRPAQTVPVDRLPARPTISRLTSVVGALRNGQTVAMEWTVDGTRYETRVTRAETGTGIPGTMTVTVHRTVDGTRARIANRSKIRTVTAVVQTVDRATR
jgi:hypothetical protein